MKQVTMESVKQRIEQIEKPLERGSVFRISIKEEFELACLRELVAVTEQRDALVVENVALRNFCKNASFDADYEAEIGMEHGGFTDALNAIKTPATDAAIASLRAEAFNDLCKAFVLHKESACLNDTDKVSVREATDALLHCAEQLARQLRESKGEVQS